MRRYLPGTMSDRGVGKKPVPEFLSAQDETLRGALWRIGDLVLDETRRELRRGDTVLSLEPKPFNLLMLLVRHPGQLLTKDELMEALWTGSIVTDSVLTRCVAKLRGVLHDDEQDWIKTVHGYGYRYDGPVELIESQGPTIAPMTVVLKADDIVPGRPNWKLLRRLGQSGDVWLAQHVKTKAYRCYKFALDPIRLAALKREVTIYRLLSQSLGDGQDQVVRIIDWNFDEPPWFIETEFYIGGSLSEWCDAQGGVQSVALPIRISIAAQIAEILAQVHGLGVLHKDLKPANVLVSPGPDAVPRVALGDFGSGRLLEPSRLEALDITRLGFTQVAIEPTSSGTPLYWAPEIVAGKPFSVQADIYSLGVILFQLVVGNLRRQLAPGWEREVSDSLLKEDIAITAEGDATKRLGSAAELGIRLRTLDTRRAALDRASEEERQRLAEKQKAERSRIRRLIVGSTMVALSLGLVASTLLFIEASQARADAQKQATRAQSVVRFLSNDLAAGVAQMGVPPKSITVQDLFHHVGLQVDDRFSSEPDTAAAVHAAIATTMGALEAPVDQYDHLSKALALRRSAGEPVNESDLQIGASLVEVAWSLGRFESRSSEFMALLDDGRTSLGPESGDLVNLQRALASIMALRGEWRRAEGMLRESAEALRHSGNGQLDLISSLDLRRAMILIDMSEFAAARNLLASLTEVADLDPRPAVLGQAYLAVALLRLGELNSAASELQSAKSFANRWFKDDGEIALTLDLFYAELLVRQDQLDAAEAEFERIRAIVESWSADGVDQSYVELQALGALAGRKKNFDGALKYFNRALMASEKRLGKSHPITLAIRLDKVGALIGLNRLEAANREISTIPEESLQSHLRCAQRAWAIAQLASAEGDYESAQLQAQRAIAESARSVGLSSELLVRMNRALKSQSGLEGISWFYF